MKKKEALSDELSALRRRAEERLQKKKGLSISSDDMHRIIHELSVHQIELEMQQEELQQSRDEMEKGLERYTELYDCAPVGYLTLARDSTILELNLKATKMLGVDRSLLKSDRLARFIDPEEIMAFNALMERVFSHQEPGFCEVLLFQKDEPSAPSCTVRIDAVVHDDGQSCWTVISDVTRQKQIERENAQLQATLVQSQKMESISRLAGGVAHEFNNMLQAMLCNIDGLLEREELDSSVHLSLADVQNSIMKSAGIVRQLLGFARKQFINPKVIDLNAAVEDRIKALEPLLGEKIKLIFTPEDHLWPVKIDSTQIDQVLINLALNAKEAFNESGTLVVTTGNVVVDEAFFHSHPETVPGDYVLLKVSDDGCGMDKDTLASIFEPFFSTKPITEGTGLGLAMVYGIVRQNLGTILAYSTKGKGTTFEIYLPRSAAEATPLSSEATEKAHGGSLGGGNAETIMVVDDERPVRELIKVFLTSSGYTLLQAESAREALSLSEAYPGTLELLITDIVMPGMNGRELAVQMSEKRPGLKTLFISGYELDSFGFQGNSRSLDMPFLAKPFSLVNLGRKVRELLGVASRT